MAASPPSANDAQQAYGLAAAPATLDAIDHEMRRIVDDCYDEACRKLRDHRGQLDALALALLEHETLEEADAYRIAGITRQTRNRRGAGDLTGAARGGRVHRSVSGRVHGCVSEPCARQRQGARAIRYRNTFGIHTVPSGRRYGCSASVDLLVDLRLVGRRDRRVEQPRGQQPPRALSRSAYPNGQATRPDPSGRSPARRATSSRSSRSAGRNRTVPRSWSASLAATRSTAVVAQRSGGPQPTSTTGAPRRASGVAAASSSVEFLRVARHLSDRLEGRHHGVRRTAGRAPAGPWAAGR